MNFISKLFKKKEEETEVVSKGSVEEFVTLIRVYYQAVMAVQLGITNLNILNDMALFKRMLKIPTQNNKLGIAEKSRSRKILMQEYGLNENFFKEIDASIKKNCKTQNDIKSYFIMYQGFNNDLFSLLDNLMQWKFRFSMLVKKLLYSQTQKTIRQLIKQIVAALLCNFQIRDFFHPLLRLLGRELVYRLQERSQYLEFTDVFFPQSSGQLRVRFMCSGNLLDFRQRNTEIQLIDNTLLAHAGRDHPIHRQAKLGPYFF